MTALLAVAVALFLAPVLSDLPEATLGAIVVVSVLGLTSLEGMRRLWSIDRLELVVAALTALAALFFNLLIGVLVGVLLTMYFVLRTINHPVIVELRRSPETGEMSSARAGDEPVPGMLVLRIEGGLYTLNVHGAQSAIIDRYEAMEPHPDVVLLDVGATVDTSVTVLDVLFETEQHLRRSGSGLWVASIPPKAEAKARRTDVWPEWVADGKVHSSVAAAVAAFESGSTAESP